MKISIRVKYLIEYMNMDTIYTSNTIASSWIRSVSYWKIKTFAIMIEVLWFLKGSFYMGTLYYITISGFMSMQDGRYYNYVDIIKASRDR